MATYRKLTKCSTIFFQFDPAAEIARLEKEIEKAKAFAASIERKLSNEKFVSGAPEAVVNAERTKLATQMDIISKNEAALKELK